MFALLRKLCRDQEGGPLVEMVLGLPLILILVVGVTQFGQAIHRHQVLTDGTRAAGRYLSRVSDPCADAEQARAAGLVVTRTIDWSEDPAFVDWPESKDEMDSDGNFDIVVEGCDETGILTGDAFGVRARNLFADDLGVLRFVNHQGGFWLEAFHVERHIGL